MNIFSRRPNRYQQVTPEGQTNWGRGMLILASMAGVFIIFFVVLSLLQYGSRETAEIRGLVTVVPQAARATTPQAASAPATAVSPGSPTGVTALVREAPYVRSGPGIDYQIVTNLQNAQTVDVIGRTIDGSWLQVILPNGVRGWSSRNFLTITGNLNNVPVTQ